MSKKRYTSVSEMLSDLPEDKAFAADFADHINQRQVVKQLVALRSAKGVSQQDVAKSLEVTQSKVSKLENGIDDDLRLGDLKGYLKAFDMDLGIVFAEHSRTITDEVKYHAFEIKRLLSKLARLAKKDEEIAKGVSSFFGEAFFNLVRMLQKSSEQLAVNKKNGRPRLSIQIQQKEIDAASEGDCLSDNTEVESIDEMKESEEVCNR